MYIHLHNHSDYSMLDGACRIPDLVKIALQQGATAVGLTDHGNLFGALDFYTKCRDAGLNPVVGCELYLAPESRSVKKPGRGGELRFHQVLLAKNYAGYRNLSLLTSEAYTSGFYYKPRIDRELLARHSEGLICLSSCMQGILPQAILDRRSDDAVELIHWYKGLFGDDFYIELMRHNLPDDERLVNGLAEMARDFGVKTVATNDAHYLRKEHAAAHDILLCVGTQAKRDDPDRLRFGSSEFYVKSEAEMRALFADFPEAIDATLEIADKCRLEIPLEVRHYPVFEIPTQISERIGVAPDPTGASTSAADAYLEVITLEGFRERYGETPSDEAKARIRRELDVIKQTGFSNYFLIVWDFVRWAKEHKVPVGPGRGSAAGCIVSYCLGITNLDPIRFGLIFERFLNPERVSPPDIDIDFADDRREEVISYVRQKYGADSVCRITTFGRMAARSAIRDVARAMGMSFGEGDKLARLIPEGVKDMTIEKAVSEVPEVKALLENDARYRELVELARVVEGAVRQSGVHAAGVVICPGPVVDYLPVHKATGEENDLFTQYDMTWMDAVGLLKMDFLGLQTLQEIELTVAAVRRKGIELDVNAVPFEDEAVFKLFGEGRTTGIFQFESGGMRDNLMKLKPERLEDLIAMNALYRPGPMAMIDEYIACRHGRKRVEFLHPKLEPILKETYGVITYQEQVIRIAVDLGGFSLGKADNLRKAMGKKKMEIMLKYQGEFVDGCVANGIDQKIAERIFDICQEFAKYSFVKAHAAGYAIVAYQCAYLKAHHPADYLAACLTVRRRDSNQTLRLLAECRNMGIKLLPPDVNESESAFRATERGIRFGMAAVKNVGDSAVEGILAARREAGRFTSFLHFLASIDTHTVNRKVVECLIDGGAFDSFGETRATLLNSLNGALAYAQAAQDERERGQETLFGGGGSSSVALPLPELQRCPEWPIAELLSREKTMLGYYISSHPLEAHRREIEGLATHLLAEKDEFTDGQAVKVCGVITAVSRKLTKNGDRWATVQIEDLTGPIECLVFPQAYTTADAHLQVDRLVAISGKISRPDENEDPKIRADEVLELERAAERWGQQVFIRLPRERVSEPFVARLQRLLEEYPGSCSVYIDIPKLSGGRQTLKIPTIRFRPAPEAISRLSELAGGDDRIQVMRG